MAPPLIDGRYELGDLLGEGGVAVVYRARDRIDGRACAIKLLRPDLRADPSIVRRLASEAELMLSVAHPNVVQVYGHGEHDGGYWIAMELCEAGSAGERVRSDGPLSPRRALQIVLQALRGLQGVHAIGAVHRDVKPDNLLLQPDGSCKLADFGIALMEDETRTTRAGFAMGSMPYMAPEQRVDAHRVTTSADLYAAGATLYFLLTGSTPVDLFMASATSPRFTGLPEPLVRLVRKATHADPSQRFEDAAQMARAVEQQLVDASDVALAAEATPVYEAPLRVHTAQGQPRGGSSQDDALRQLESTLRQELDRSDTTERQAAARRVKRLSLALGITLVAVTVGLGARLVLDDWLARADAVRVGEALDPSGPWRGVLGSHEASLVLTPMPTGGWRARLTVHDPQRGDLRYALAGSLDRGRLLLESYDGPEQLVARFASGPRLVGDWRDVDAVTHPLQLVRASGGVER